jgi:hypothetical protein
MALSKGARAARALLIVVAFWVASSSAAAQDRNITLPVADLERMLGSEPMQIVKAEISRPKLQGAVDITLKADVSFSGRPPLLVKVRPAERGAQAFNNVPRYDLAAYELQKLLMDTEESVVPPTSVRMVPLAEMKRYSSDVRTTFPGSDDVLCVVQYWLQDVTVPQDVLFPERFESDALYARHIGQLNVFTYLINHRDSNLGRSRGRVRLGVQRPRRAVALDAREAAASRYRGAPAQTHGGGARISTRRARGMEARERSLRCGLSWNEPGAAARRTAQGERRANGPVEQRDRGGVESRAEAPQDDR